MTTWRKLTHGSYPRIAGNAVSVLTSEAMNRATTLIVNVMVARFLGEYIFGQLSLALTLYYSFYVFAQVGLRTLITREVARDKANSDKYLINGSLIVTLTSLSSVVCLFLFASAMRYSNDTILVIVLLSFGLLPYVLSTICESVIRAWERMHLIAYANVPANILKVAACYWGLVNGWDVKFIVLVLVLSRVLVLIVEWGLLLAFMGRPRFVFELGFAFELVKSGMPFMGIYGLVTIWSAVNVVLLSKFYGENEVGLYTAAVQLLTPVRLVFQNVMASVFPILCRKFDTSFENLRQVAGYLLEFLWTIAVPSAIGLYYLSDSITLALYGKIEFMQSAAVLRVISWTLILTATTQALGNVLLAGRREKTTLRIAVVDVLVSVIAGVILISRYGPMGAAYTLLLSRCVDFLQHYLLVSRHIFRLPVARIAWKTLLASVIMTFCLVQMNSSGLIIPIVTGVTVYVTALLFLIVLSTGTLRPFTVR